MKESVRIVRHATLFLAAAAVLLGSYTTARADYPCTPTQPLARQNRTRMKHWSLPPQNLQTVAVSANTLLTWAPARGVGTPGFRTLENALDAKEVKVFVLTGNLWRINVEANDCDFHLEISAPDGTATSDRVIVEIPQGTRYRGAREALIQRLTQLGITLHRQTPLQTPIPIKVMGYGFYDAAHYTANDPQRGHNHGSEFVGTVWELHPVWRIGSP